LPPLFIYRLPACLAVTISLGGNNIGDIGAEKMAEALKINNTITTSSYLIHTQTHH
jgi:hypothetical protein